MEHRNSTNLKAIVASRTTQEIGSNSRLGRSKNKILPQDSRLQQSPINTSSDLSSCEDYIRPQFMYIDGIKHVWCATKNDYVVLSRRCNKKKRSSIDHMNYDNPTGSFKRYLRSIEKVDYIDRKKQRNKKLDMLAGASMLRDVEGKIDRSISRIEKKTGRKACVEDMIPMFTHMDLHNGVEGLVERNIEIKRMLDEITSVNPLWKVITNFMEDLSLTCTILYESTSWKSSVAAVIMFLKLRTGGSLLSSTLSLIYELSSSKMDVQSGSEYMFMGKEKSWLSFTHMGIFPRIGSMISLMVTAGLVPAHEFKIADFKVFSAQALEKQKTAKDVFDCGLETMLYFMECGHQLYRGTLLDFLKGEKDALAQLDDDVIHLNAYINAVKFGNYFNLTGKTVASYHDLLLRSKTAIKTLIQGSKHDKVMMNILNVKYQKLCNLQVEYEQSEPLSGMREAPYCISVFGPSAMGKSSVVNIISKQILLHSGFPSDDNNYCTLQPDDKFYSTMRSDTTCVILDDVANTVTDKANVNPADRLILLVNNIPYFAPKAIAEEKGKIQVRPRLVALTTNIKDINACDWSQEPVSVLRRINVIITVSVRIQFQDSNSKLDARKLFEHIDGRDVKPGVSRDAVIPDCWLLRLETIKTMPPIYGTAELFKHVPVVFEGKEMIDIDIYTAIRCLNKMSGEYYAHQDKLVESQKELGHKMNACTKCHNYGPMCTCETPEFTSPNPIFIPSEPVEELPPSYEEVFDNLHNPGGPKMDLQSGLTWIPDQVASYVVARISARISELWNMTIYDKATVCGMTELAIFKYTHSINNNPFALINYVPDEIKDSDWFKWFYMYWQRGRTRRLVSAGRYLATIPFSVLTMTLAYRREWRAAMVSSGLFACTYIITSIGMYHVSYQICTTELAERKLSSLITAQSASRAWNGVIIAGVSMATAIVAVKSVKLAYEMYLQSLPEVQGSLSPATVSDIFERDSQPNVWSHKSSKPFSDIGTGTYTHDQLSNLVAGNCMYVETTIGMKVYRTSAIFITSNVLLLPLHFMCEGQNPYMKKHDIMELKIYRADKNVGGSSFFTEHVCSSSVVRVGNHDLALVSLHSGGTFNDLVRFLDVAGKKVQTSVVYRNSDGLIDQSVMASFTPGEYVYPFTPTQLLTYKGGYVSYNRSTFKGMCIAAHIAKIAGPRIIGFHIAGHTNQNKGFIVSPTQKEVQLAIDVLHATNGTFQLHSNGEIPATRYGKELNIVPDVSLKSPICFIGEYNLTLCGSIGTQVTYFSEIKKSMLASHIPSIFGFHGKWGKPEFRPHYLPWYNSLIHIAKPRHSLPADKLKIAKDNYVAPLLEKLPWYIENKGIIRPLTDAETINGIHGVRFIDAMKFQSSAGYPVGGPKSNLFKGPDGAKEWRDPSFMGAELDRMRSAYLDGKRYHPIFKACLKDEPTEIGSGKVRVFQAGDLIIQYALRKYTLSIARFLSVYPLLSEIAVGINCYSSEWQQLIDHVTTKGENDNTILAGDYSKWDLRLPAQLVSMAFNVIIMIAQASGNYTSEDITILKGLATDVTYYMCHYNGTFFMAHGGMASGHTLTAHLNSICNALLVRIGFYSVYPSCVDFRSAVKIVFYGDDFMGGVSPSFPLFDFLVYQSILHKYEIVITPPEKKAVPKKYLTLQETDFLKRRSVYIPEIKHSVGALAVDSLFKSLFCRGKLGCSKEEHAVSVLESFKRELFCHGKEVFDDYSPKLVQLSKAVELHVPLLEKDYQYFVRAWLDAESKDAGVAHLIDTTKGDDPDYSDGAVLDLSPTIEYYDPTPLDPIAEGDELYPSLVHE